MYTTDEDYMRTNYKCANCCASCPNKYTFDLHKVMCNIIHKSQYENSLDKFFSQSSTPSPEAQFHYIFHLNKKVEELENKMAKLQKTIVPLCRRQVSEYLETLEPPEKIYSEWLQSIEISDEVLEHILKTDLKTGIKQLFEDIFPNESVENNSPIRAFTQKPNIFYLYDTNAEWRKMTTEEFTKFIGRVEHKCLRKYLVWSNLNREHLTGSPQAEERAVLYMGKVNGVKQGSVEQRASDIKKWLFSKMAVSLKQVVV